jgi:hypothetical protein
MTIDLDDIAAPEPAGEFVAFRGAKGDRAEIQVHPLTNTQIIAVGRKYPDFKRSMFREDAPDDFRNAAIFEAAAAIVAAGTGHAGDPRWESAFERMDSGDLMKLAGAIMRLTTPRVEETAGREAGASPLEQAANTDAAAG